MSNPRRNSTTHSVNSGASFQTDEDGSEMGHLSVSVSELNQLRQHVRNMRKNMTGRNRNRDNNLAPAAGDNNSVLEEVDLAGRSGSGPAGLMVSEDAMTPEQKRRVFRISIVGNILFVLGSILYICVAHGDLQWAQEIQGIPTTVLEADDDVTWRDWQQQQQQQRKQPADRRLNNYHNNPDSWTHKNNGKGMQKDNNQDFNEMLWQDLPADIQLALMVLGHNRHTWNNAMTSSIEEQPWNKLTDEQRDAAKVIGYSAEEWDEEQEEEEEMWKASQQAYFTTTDGDDLPEDDMYADDRYDDGDDDRYQEDGDDRFQDDQYEDEGDDQEPQDDRYEDEGDDDQEPEDDRYEDDQEPEDDRYEDEGDDQEPEDDRYEDEGDDQEPEDDRYEDEDDDQVVDDDLPDDDKVAAAGDVFDWYKQSENDDYYPQDVSTGIVSPRPTPTARPTTSTPATAPPTTSPSTTDAAPGTKYTIDGDVIPSSTNPPGPSSELPQLTRAPEVPRDVQSPEDLMIWGEYDWEQLPPAVQKAFEILGYNEELWNTGGTALTEDLYWADLTPAQQQQAGVLGYNQVLWDLAEDGNYDITTGEQGDDAVEDDEYDEDEDYEESYDGDDQVTLTADDFDDDIETEAVTLFFAALCFMIAGVMSWIRERQVFHMWMVQGGVFGILSALTMGFSDFASLLLQTVSVHCFMLQSFFMLRLRKTIRPVEGLEKYSYALWGADILFAAGAFIQVIMVYWMHGDEDAYYDVGLGYGEVTAAWFWFFTSVIYTMNTLALASKRMEEDNATRTLTIQRQHPNGETYTIRPAAIQLREKPQPPCHDVVLT